MVWGYYFAYFWGPGRVAGVGWGLGFRALLEGSQQGSQGITGICGLYGFERKGSFDALETSNTARLGFRI